MSEFHVETVRLGPLEKHPNADSLSITQVHGGYPCIVRTDEWKEGDIGVYVPVDALVPIDHPVFDWLKHSRIKAKKIRGVFSMGLLVKTHHTEPGINVQAELGIEKYETAVEKERPVKIKTNTRSVLEEWCITLFSAAVILALCLGAPWWSALVLGTITLVVYFTVSHYNKPLKRPSVPVYDIEGYRKHTNLFQPGELVQLTEKIHGCNARYVHDGKRLHIGSRTQWRNDGIWAEAATRFALANKLKNHPNVVLFGEIYGHGVQDLDYGCYLRFAAFDAMYLHSGEFMGVNEFKAFCYRLGIPTVPELYVGPWDPSLVQHAEGKSTIAKHCREGFVVRPLVESQCRIGRKQLKLVGQDYLCR